MHVLHAEAAHSLGCGGKNYVTSLNRFGLSLSYDELRHYQCDMAAYTVSRNETQLKYEE